MPDLEPESQWTAEQPAPMSLLQTVEQPAFKTQGRKPMFEPLPPFKIQFFETKKIERASSDTEPGTAALMETVREVSSTRMLVRLIGVLCVVATLILLKM